MKFVRIKNQNGTMIAINPSHVVEVIPDVDGITQLVLVNGGYEDVEGDFNIVLGEIERAL